MEKANRKIRTIHVRLSAREDAIVKTMEDNGYSISEVIRELLRDFGRREFPRNFKPLPAYVEASLIKTRTGTKTLSELEKESRMTDREYAEQVLRGHVVGDRVYFCTPQSYVPLPLQNIKRYRPDSDQMFITHAEILDNTFIFPNGVKMEDGDRERIIEGWKNL